MNLKDYVRSIPDFPKPGILFRDITPMLASPDVFQFIIDRFADKFRDREVTAVISRWQDDADEVGVPPIQRDKIQKSLRLDLRSS